MVNPKDGSGIADIVRLWTHESLRVFGDRLVDDADREWLLNHLDKTVSNDVVLFRLRISTWLLSVP